MEPDAKCPNVARCGGMDHPEGRLWVTATLNYPDSCPCCGCKLEPLKRQHYVAAYTAPTGKIIAMGTPNAIRRYAEQDVARLRAQDPGMEYFVAVQNVPEWTRAT